MLPRRAGTALVVSALLFLAGCTGAPDRELQYVVVPHPDDEYQAWSLVAERPETYPVFVLLTRGERTALCDGRAFQPEHGERPPQPQPFDPDDEERCAAQRVDAWHAFLDGMADLDDTLDVPEEVGTFEGEAPAGAAAPDSTRFDLHVGDDSARVVFDLGDGQLRADEVTWAIQATRELRGEHFATTAEGDVVGAAFANTGLPDCVAYDHPDHVAVHDALGATDQETGGAQLARTCESDPDASVLAEVDEELHDAVWNVSPGNADPAGNPAVQREGVAQRVYGWLAFSFTDGGQHTYWALGDDDTTAFSRRQAFRSAFDD